MTLWRNYKTRATLQRMATFRFLLLSSALFLVPLAFAEPAPQLVALDASLARTQEDHRRGRLEPKAYEDAIAAFRTELAATVSGLEPSSDNAALHARILSRLGDPKEAFAALGPAMARDPGDAVLRVALSQVLLEQKNYPAALAEANAVLELDPGNKAALAIKFESQGRAEPSRATTSAQAPAEGAAAGVEVVTKARAPQPIVVPSLDSAESSVPVPESGGLPLWPVLPAAGLGVAAFTLRKSRTTVESEDGFNEDDRPQPGRLQEFVAGAVLAGMAGGAIYLGGVYVVAIGIPIAQRFMAGPGQQAMRLAHSQAGAINLGKEKAVNEVPRVLARVIPFPDGSELPPTIGKYGDARVFVTAADDIAGLNAQQLAARLGINPSDRFLIMRFPAPKTTIATPINHPDARFVGRGSTIGKAREFVMPNVPIPPETTLEIIK